MIALVLGVAVALALGAALVRACGGAVATAEGIAASLGLGLGASTVLGFFVLAAAGGASRAGLWLELAAALVLAVGLWRRSAAPRSVRLPGSARTRLLAGLVALAFVAWAALIFFRHVERAPHGGWDAVAIWNVRARFLVQAEDWTRALETARGHPDYPLLVPLAVARGWLALGRESLAVPQGLAALFLLATAGLLGAAVARRRGAALGVAALGAYLAAPAVLFESAQLLADVPLGFFLLFTAVAVADGRWAAAGLGAALAAWCKNEGLLVFALGALALLCSERRAWRSFAVGAAPVLAALLLFKLAYAPDNNLVEGQGWQASWARLTDVSRPIIVVQVMAHYAWRTAGVFLAVVPIAVLAIGMRRPSRPELTATGLLLAMVGGYALVYVLTPNDLVRHLDTSCVRLWLQLTPTALFVALGTWTRPPAEAPLPETA